jgi:hypothetical protein
MRSTRFRQVTLTSNPLIEEQNCWNGRFAEGGEMNGGQTWILYTMNHVLSAARIWLEP